MGTLLGAALSSGRRGTVGRRGGLGLFRWRARGRAWRGFGFWYWHRAGHRRSALLYSGGGARWLRGQPRRGHAGIIARAGWILGSRSRGGRSACWLGCRLRNGGVGCTLCDAPRGARWAAPCAARSSTRGRVRIGGGLVRNGRQTLRQNIGGADPNVVFRGGLPFLLLDQHQDFFQLAEVGGRPDLDVQKQVFAFRNLRDGADRQALGENLVATAGQHGFAHGNLLIAHDALQHDFACCSPAQDALQPRLFQQCAHAAALIADQQHLRNRCVGHEYLAHNPVGSHDSHVAFDAVILALVDVDRAGKVAAAGTDDLCGHGAGDELFLESDQGLQPPGLGSVFAEPHLFEPHLLNLVFQLAVFGAHSAQITIIVPEIAGAVLSPDQSALERSDRAHSPDADEARAFRVVAAAAFDLRRQPQHLQKQDSYQNDQVAVAAEYGFHESSFKFLVSSL